ncbi:hypothetical protein MRB53_039322 [Persea americana]|nr:hypothetical protein MRB53_039322 [Persea americana]
MTQGSQDMSSSWLLPAGVIAVTLGAAVYLSGYGRKRRRPTQHDLDPTLKKNQVRITTQKKAFRRDELPPEYLARIERRDIVEIPMGAPRPMSPTSLSQVESKSNSSEWLPDHLENNGSKKQRKGKSQK